MRRSKMREIDVLLFSDYGEVEIYEEELGQIINEICKKLTEHKLSFAVKAIAV